jgi:hypothetical protein
MFHRPIAYIGGGERDGLGGSLESATDSGIELAWRTTWHVSVSPILGGTSLVELVGALFRPNPLSNIFCIFQNEPSV